MKLPRLRSMLMGAKFCTCFSVAAFLLHCTSSSPTSSSCDGMSEACPDKAEIPLAVTHSSQFGTSLFSFLCLESSNEGENVLFSPLSVTQSLALLRDGATEQSENESELARLLGPQAVLEEARSLHRRASSVDGRDADVELTLATSIWTKLLRDSYIETAKSKHLAEAFPLPSQYSEVNKWVANRTKGVITNILDESKPVDPLVRGLLVNAVHFKGKWTEKFDNTKTVDGVFRLRSKPGAAANAPAKYMIAKRDMNVIQKSSSLGGASVLLLDYEKSNAQFSSMFILPATADLKSMNDVISGLNQRPIVDLLHEARNISVKLKLPRFRLKFGPSSIKTSLRKMGVNLAFDGSGVFHQMSDDPDIYVDDILHGASMEVTEEGTVAAAVTAVKIATRSMMMPPPPFELSFDRPFVVVVVHRSSGIPIFMGRVEDPELIFSS